MMQSIKKIGNIFVLYYFKQINMDKISNTQG